MPTKRKKTPRDHVTSKSKPNVEKIRIEDSSQWSDGCDGCQTEATMLDEEEDHGKAGPLVVYPWPSLGRDTPRPEVTQEVLFNTGHS